MLATITHLERDDMKASTLLGVSLAMGVFAACSGGGGSSGGTSGALPTPAPTLAPPANSTQQVISLALPTTAIGRENDPVFGAVGGYSQQAYSQVLGFVPGTQVMIRNGDSARPHTLGDTGASSFPSGQPAALSLTGTGTATFASGWQSGTIASGKLIGPITLQSGTYFIGCAYHYASDGMRDVLVVAANATPGPQATQAPGAPAPAPTAGGGFGY